MNDLLARLIATGFYSGQTHHLPDLGRTGSGKRIRVNYAGTWGTIPAWLIAYFLMGGHQTALAAASIVTFVLSIWSAGIAEKTYGHDARKIVIDEWAGMFISVIMVPFSLPNYIIAFVAFRVFDVAKIPPARQCEKLPGGLGITMDDVVAGIQANILLQVLIRVLHVNL
jgi:phosphatidylglycerophosphatase A